MQWHVLLKSVAGNINSEPCFLEKTVSPNCCKVFPLPSCNTTQKESGISWDHGIVMDSAMVPCKDIWRCHTIYTTEWRPHDTSWKWNLCPQESPAVQSYQQTRVEAIQIPCPNAMTLTGACMDSQLRLVKSMFRWRNHELIFGNPHTRLNGTIHHKRTSNVCITSKSAMAVDLSNPFYTKSSWPPSEVG